MSTLGISLLLKPFIAIAIMCLIVVPIKWVFWKFLPEGRLKRFLFISWKV